MAEENSNAINKNTQKFHSTFTKRYLKFEFIGGVDKKGNKTYFAKKQGKAVVEKLRATVSITYNSGSSLPECDCSIYNVNQELANALTGLGQYQQSPQALGNILIIYASTNGSDPENPTYTQIFAGGISVAYTDYGSAPEVIFHIRAMSLGGLNLVPAKSLSFRGKGDVAGIIESIINNYNRKSSLKPGDTLYLTFKNFGVKAHLNNANYSGDVIEQIRKCANDAHIRFGVNNGLIYIWPMDKSLNDGMIQSGKNKEQTKKVSPRIFSHTTGMVGYPAYANDGITVRSIFTGAITFGEEIYVESRHIPANGLWKYMISMQHELSCFTPNGSWLTTIGVSNKTETERAKESKSK
ncbi:unnamed protein product [Commensalibacter communis]|uniref:hypothetical protein n=1 Tax=Commensalibacter communis TaxID=2972786 RepID=UPI0022FF8199|nr:hypothetical protein [Commensalibacter communis]CAI3958405.1 unnamed protein product [Commensalibacter communis]CAI3958783.1 unnamed protein product [Commensalibacter communis]CAI3959570.1 unnamed protein product [Commensalibacter communis]